MGREWGLNTLATARHNITLAITQELPDLSTYGFVPGRPNVPCFVVEPGSPYMSEGETFCDFNVRFSCILLADNATNENATEKLDQLICEVIDALDAWTVESVEQPSQFEVNNNHFLGTRIDIVAPKTLTI